jgi:hypothetical protein
MTRSVCTWWMVLVRQLFGMRNEQMQGTAGVAGW